MTPHDAARDREGSQGADSVLEQNLRNLLRRSYVAQRPREPFRSALRARLLNDFERRRTRGTGPRRWQPMILAAAIALFVLGWLLRSNLPRDEVQPSLAALLDAGCSAFRVAEYEEFQAAPERLEFTPPRLEVATPQESTYAIGIGTNASLVLDAKSRIVLHGSNDSPRIRARVLLGSAQLGRDVLTSGIDYQLHDGRLERPPLQTPSGPGERTSQPDANPPPESTPPPIGPALIARIVADGRPLERCRTTFARFSGANGEPSVHWEDREVELRDEFARFEVRVAGRYRLYADVDGYAVSSTELLWLAPNAPPREVTLTLVRGATVRGIVRSAVTGNPLANALVLSENETGRPLLPCSEPSMLGFGGIPSRAVRTDAEGRFELLHVEPGAPLIRAQHDEHVPAWQALSAVQDGDLREDVTFGLVAGATIDGMVFDETGKPVAKSIIAAMNQTLALPSHGQPVFVGRSESTGKFEIPNLPGGTYTVIDLSPDPEHNKVDLQRLKLLALAPRGRAHVEFGRARGECLVVGQLLTADGAPAANRVIAISEGDGSQSMTADWRSTSTDDQGRFLFKGVASGPHMIYRVVDSEGVDDIAHVTIPAATTHSVSLRLSGLSLRGQVLDRTTGAPISNAYLVLQREVSTRRDPEFAGKGPTRADGRFEFCDMLPGTYRIGVVAFDDEHAVAFSEPLVLSSDSRVDPVRILVDEGGRATVRVLDADQRSVAGAELEIRTLAGLDVSGLARNHVDDAGASHFQNLPLGELEIRVQAEGFEPHQARMHIESTRDESLTLVLRRTR